MRVMRLPGFAAEVSAYRTTVHYRMAGSIDQRSPVSAQRLAPQACFPAPQGCLPVGNICRDNSDCCTGWCNENNNCDCFDIGDECRLGSASCCSGTCVAGICGPPAAINVGWLPLGDGRTGLVLVTGQNFTPGQTILVDLTNCDLLGGNRRPTANGSGQFSAWVWCSCGGATTVTAYDSSGNCAQETYPTPCPV